MAKKNSSPSKTSTRRRTTAQPAKAADSNRGPNSGAAISPSPDEIAEAAYHRYLSRGGSDGGDFGDWLEAERELREQRSR